MRGYIDRIEGKTAVMMVEGAGEVLVPLKALRFKAYEGMHVLFKVIPDPDSQSKTELAIKTLQNKLLKRNH